MIFTEPKSKNLLGYSDIYNSDKMYVVVVIRRHFLKQNGVRILGDDQVADVSERTRAVIVWPCRPNMTAALS